MLYHKFCCETNLFEVMIWLEKIWWAIEKFWVWDGTLEFGTNEAPNFQI